MSLDEFVAPELIVEGKAIASAVMSLPLPDIRKMPRAEREMNAWIEYRRQMGALRIANLARWGLNQPEAKQPKANRSQHASNR